jgi:histidinol-phosphate aminotransferase
MAIASRNFLDSLRPEIRTLPAYNSGLSAELVRARYGVSKVAKLGSNENPWGTSPRVQQAIAASIADSAQYPDPSSMELRSALSSRLGVASERFAFGNGSEDLISVCAHAFLAPGDEMVTILPSFGLHGIYAQAAGARVHMVSVRSDYSIDAAGLIGAITARTRMVMFSSPSNPAGTTISGEELERLLAALPEEALLIFDEAYFEYAAKEKNYPHFLEILKRSDATWILLRTFSKAYGLAGLRVGYAVASHAGLIDVIDRARTPFNVNRLAQAAALAALEEAEFMDECISRTLHERERLRDELTALGYRCAPSVANFLFVDVREDSSQLAQRLLPEGVIVKPWREAGFTNHIRVSIGTPENNDQFLASLRQAAQPGTVEDK